MIVLEILVSPAIILMLSIHEWYCEDTLKCCEHDYVARSCPSRVPPTWTRDGHGPEALSSHYRSRHNLSQTLAVYYHYVLSTFKSLDTLSSFSKGDIVNNLVNNHQFIIP